MITDRSVTRTLFC